MPDFGASTIDLRDTGGLDHRATIVRLREVMVAGADRARSDTREVPICRCLTLLLISAWLAVDTNLWVTCLRGPIYPHPMAAGGLGFVFAQIALIGFAFVHSRARLTVRSVLVLGLLSGSAQLAARLAGESEQPARWGALLLLYAALTIATLYAVEAHRLLRGWLLRSQGRPQWTVAGLLDLTTALGLWLGAVHWTIGPNSSLPQLVAFCGLMAFASVTPVVCMACRPKICGLGLLTLLLACPLLAVLLGKTDIPPAGTRPLVILLLAQYTGLSCSLAVLRIAGYRGG